MKKGRIRVDNNSLLDFLTFSYFGLTYSELEEKSLEDIAVICARRAYLDLARTLTYKRNNAKETYSQITDVEKDENTFFKENICVCLGKRVSEFLDGCKPDNKPSLMKFNEWHDEVCKCITACGKNSDALVCRQSNKKENEKFYYGHAQKWLNMTLKYMTLLNVEEVLNVRDLLHVPIDQYILKAAAEEKNRGEHSLKKMIAPKNHNGDDKADKLIYFSDGTTQPWSQLNRLDYIDLQKDIRREIIECKKEKANNWKDISCPLDWESKVWIEQAKLEKEKQQKKKEKD